MEGREQIAQIDKGSMKRVLGVSDVFAVGFGDLGSSIFYALGITAMFALGATPIALMLAGLIFACTALSYAELSSMITESGGSASFSRKAFNDLISFIAGWGLLLDYIVTIAISAFSVPPYLSFFFPTLNTVWIAITFTIFIILSLLVLNIIGTKHSTRLSWILTALTLATQAVIIVIGAFLLLDPKELFSHMVIGGSDAVWSPSWGDFAKGCAMAMVAYTGVESMAQLSSEAKKPEKTVPKAIIIAMVTLLVIYLGLSSIALSAITPQKLSTQYLENPVAGIIASLPFGSDALGAWVGILAAILLYVASNAGLIGASRLCFNMSEYYQIPRFMYRLHPKTKTPYVALTIFAIFACIIVIASGGQLAFLADLYNFGAMMAFFSAHLSLITLRIKNPRAKRPFKVPFNLRIKGYEIPISALFGALATASTWFLVVFTKPDGRYLGLTWLIIGCGMYYFYRKKQRIPFAGNVGIHKIKMPQYKRSDYKHLLVPTRAGAATNTIQMACELAKVHKADVTIVHIIEVPFSLSINNSHTESPEGLAILNQAEAIAREFQVPASLKIIQARSVKIAVKELIETGEYDLIVMGGSFSSKNGNEISKEISLSSKVPVFVCYSEQTISRLSHK